MAREISVVIPVWGDEAASLVGASIASVEAQDFPAEVIVVDNASDPPLPAKPGVTIVRSERRLSLWGARKLGLDAVETPYVMPFDADDVLLPGSLARLAAVLRDRPELGGCCGAITDGHTRERHHWPRRSTFAVARFPLVFATLNATSSLYPVPGSLFRTEMLRAAASGEAGGADDWVLAVALAFRGAVAFDPVPNRVYARREGSISSAWTTGDALAHARAVRRRLRSDPAVPARVRALIPLIAVAQNLVLRVLRPLAAKAAPRRRREGR